MIDLSDGIASDAAHLAAANGLCVEVDLARLPLADGLARAAALAGEEAAIFAARGGEDYELLVALPAGFDTQASKAFSDATGLAITEVGGFAVGRGVKLLWRGSAVELRGYDHFA